MNISILGSTGSIGRQTVDVALKKGWGIRVISLEKNIKIGEEQIRLLRPDICAVSDEKAAKELKIAVADTDTRVLSGEEGIIEAASCHVDTVVNSIVGMAGLRPTLAAIDNSRRIALANKETLVCAGGAVMKNVRESGCELVPVDSEHSAIFRCLQGYKRYKKILLTASGGPFFGRKAEEIANASKSDVLAHPTWTMGAKITVDSATLMNKGFEVIEACRLYDCTPDDIEVMVHRESVVHSMVEFDDNSILAQLSLPDMRECIQYALTYPGIESSPLEELDLKKLGRLTFYDYDGKTFPLLDFAKEVYKKGGNLPSAMNGANEEAVALFLDDKISFGEISDLVMKITSETGFIEDPGIDEIIMTGKDASERLKAAAENR